MKEVSMNCLVCDTQLTGAHRTEAFSVFFGELVNCIRNTSLLDHTVIAACRDLIYLPLPLPCHFEALTDVSLSEFCRPQISDLTVSHGTRLSARWVGIFACERRWSQYSGGAPSPQVW